MNEIEHPLKRDEKRMESLKHIGLKAACIAQILAEHRQAQQKIQKRTKLANYAVGAIVMLFGFLSFVPSFQQSFGHYFPVAIVLMGAIFLLADAYVPHVLEDPSPDRFGDYAVYINKYARDIETHINDFDLSSVHWNAKADLLSDWARSNIDDVFVKWTWVRPALDQLTEFRGVPTEFQGHYTKFQQ